MVEESKEVQQRRAERARTMKRFMLYFTASVMLIASAALIYWFVWGQYEDSTEDAYVHGNIVHVSTQVPGTITSVHTDNMCFVRQGQVLYELDKTDYEIEYEKSLDNLGEVVRSVSKLYQEIDEMQANVLTRQVEKEKAYINYINRKNLVDEGAVSKEDYLDSKYDYEASITRLESAQSKLKQIYALTENTTIENHPLVLKAATDVQTAYVNLKRCVIRAPSDGIVSKRYAQVGTHIEPRDRVIAIVPLNQIWVQANYKETDLSEIRVGQRATIYADIYGSGVKYSGTVTGIDGGSGAVFSLIPPQNATGNWIKIVQRIPVRIDLDHKDLERHPLRLGASMHVTIDTENQHGTYIPEYKGDSSIYETNVYDYEEIGVQGVIEDVIRKNIYLGEPESLTCGK